MTRITGTLYEDRYSFLIISRSVLLRIRNVSDKVVEKIKIHILCSITFFFFLQNRAVLRDNVEKSRRARQATDDNMAHAHCVLDT